MANVTQFNRTNTGEAILLDVQGLQDALQCGRGTAVKNCQTGRRRDQSRAEVLIQAKKN